MDGQKIGLLNVIKVIKSCGIHWIINGEEWIKKGTKHEMVNVSFIMGITVIYFLEQEYQNFYLLAYIFLIIIMTWLWKINRLRLLHYYSYLDIIYTPMSLKNVNKWHSFRPNTAYLH